MKRRDRLWIALIWIVAVAFGAVAALFGTDADPRTKVEVAVILAAVDGVLATGLYFAARRNLHDRRDVLWMTAIWAPLLGVTALVLVAAPEHSYNAGWVAGFIGFFLTGWHLDRRRRERKARMKALRLLRPCPKCGEDMLREADGCPECDARSTPWIQQDGVWLTQDDSGTWRRWNEAGERFEPYRVAGALTDGPVGGQRSAAHDAKLWR